VLEAAVFGGAIVGARRYALFMTQPPDLEARVTALETQVRELDQRVRHSEQDAAAARVLAGGADRDVSEIRTEVREFRAINTRMLNALRQDMTDGFARVDERFARVDERFARVDEQFARVDERFARVDEQFVGVHGGFAEMRGKFDAMAAGLQQITGMLTTLIERDGGEQPDAE
jgi:chromosome segregation ATPase